MTPNQEAEVLRLRSAKVGTKQIAHKLKLRPAEVTAVIQANAATLLLPLYECRINHTAYQRLLAANTRQNHQDDGDEVGGLAQVIVARQDGPKYLVGSYLVNSWGLGLKDLVPPRTMGNREYQIFQDEGMTAFEEAFNPITLDQARAIIFGAIDYAQNLGLTPTNSFNRRAQMHLGDRPETLIPIEFGKAGQPYFICGPYDNPEKIISTLETNVGEGNFHYVMPAGSPGLTLLDD